MGYPACSRASCFEPSRPSRLCRRLDFSGWLTLKKHLEADEWAESRLEAALFYYRQGGRLLGILVTYVDDIEGGVHEKYVEKALVRSWKALEFAVNHFRVFISSKAVR